MHIKIFDLVSHNVKCNAAFLDFVDGSMYPLDDYGNAHLAFACLICFAFFRRDLLHTFLFLIIRLNNKKYNHTWDMISCSVANLILMYLGTYHMSL